MRSSLETCSAVRTTPCTASRRPEAVRYCENTGSDLRHLHFHEIHLAMARCDEAKRFGPVGRCNRMGLTLSHIGRALRLGIPSVPRLPTAPRTNHGQPTAQTKGEWEIIPYCGFSPKLARKPWLSFLSCLRLDTVLRSLGSRGHRIG
jgi:hypothetical protein